MSTAGIQDGEFKDLGQAMPAGARLVLPDGVVADLAAQLVARARAGEPVRLTGAAEEGYIRRALERAGLGSGLSRAGMEALGFCVCIADLEAELIRAIGPESVEQLIDAQGDLRSFRISPAAACAPRPEHRGAAAPFHGDAIGPQKPVRATACRHR
jgi:hypothetical protein